MALECTVLPTQHSEFARSSYWNTFFTKRGRRPFEWYGEYTDLVDIFNKYIRKQEAILVPGCGNSMLSECLYDMQGCHNITNIDTSTVVIRQMTGRSKHRKGMVYVQEDATKTKFQDGQFSVIVDKGTLDAIMYAPTDACYMQGLKLLEEYNRLLKVGGRCIIISLVQDHILRLILEYFFLKENWMVRFHRCTGSEEKHLLENPEAVVMPVFAVVATKFKRTLGIEPPLIELSAMTDKAKKMHGGPDQLMYEVRKMQEFALYRHRARRVRLDPNDEMRFVVEDNNGDVRYELLIVDNDSEEKPVASVGVFIVPRGRERSFLYGSKEGRRQLVRGAGYERLIIVLLQSQKFYEDIESIKNELSNHVLDLTGPGFVQGTQVPFLTEGESITGKIRCQGQSEMSGQFVIEETVPPESANDSMYISRRLVFLSNKHMIQSEARLKRVSARRGRKKRNSQGLDVVLDSALNGSGSLESASQDHSYELDFSDLSCKHHVAVVGGLALMGNENFPLGAEGLSGDVLPRVLIIGLGGGCLPMFLKLHFPCLSIDVVEIDPSMCDVAKEWFGFREDDRLRVIIDDGLLFLKKCAEKGEVRYDAIVFDVSNGDTTAGLSCPPLPFVDEPVINNVKKCLRSGGVFILNLATRSDIIKQSIQRQMCSWFDRVFVTPIEQEINEILFCILDESVEELVYKSGDGNQEAAESDGGPMTAGSPETPKSEENGGETQKAAAVEEEEDVMAPICRNLQQTLSLHGIPGLRVISSPSDYERNLKFERVLSEARLSFKRVLTYLESHPASDSNSVQSPDVVETSPSASKSKRKRKPRKKNRSPGENKEPIGEHGEKEEVPAKEEEDRNPLDSKAHAVQELDETVALEPSPNDETAVREEDGAAKKDAAGKKSKKNRKKKKKVSGDNIQQQGEEKSEENGEMIPLLDDAEGEFCVKMARIFERLGLMGRDGTDMSNGLFPVAGLFQCD